MTNGGLLPFLNSIEPAPGTQKSDKLGQPMPGMRSIDPFQAPAINGSNYKAHKLQLISNLPPDFALLEFFPVVNIDLPFFHNLVELKA